MFDHFSLPAILISYVALLFSLSVHEASHAGAAYLLDDDTAARQGRLTLNPLAHIDPIGTVLMPLSGFLLGGVIPARFFIGWAKPVPFTPYRLTRRFRMRTSAALISAAGPASNLVLALLFTVITALSVRFLTPSNGMDLAFLARPQLYQAALSGPEVLSALGYGPGQVLLLALSGRLVIINISLAIFNLLPLGPLDGAGMLGGFIPDEHVQKYDRWRYHPATTVILLALLFLGLAGHVLAPLWNLTYSLIYLPLARLILGV